MVSRRALRLLFATLLVASVAGLAYGAATAPTTASADSVPRPEPRDGHTVVTESAKFGTIVAWRPNGSLLHYGDAHTKYFDVDPVEGESLTVEYAATDTIHTSGPTCESPPCTRNVIERLNLSTGETREIYARYDDSELAAEWHDHVRVGDERILIADIVDDQVFVVNTTTELVEWRWDAQSDFPVEGGGPYPEDWAHINDVSLLDDGRVAVSLRNQDQVVFLDRETGLVENWTLGSDGDHATLYEQHNPDYIPPERGGPAAVVADSENGRIVEYQRVDPETGNATTAADGVWRRTWQWQDARIQWPRDADRLPNGNTLIADTHGKRVLEVDPQGEVVWSVPVSHPYDVERLETGGESAGGESAARLGLESRTADRSTESGFDPLEPLSDLVSLVVPSRVVNGVIFLSPVWMGRPEFAAALLGIGTVLAWVGAEVRWRLPEFGVRWPVYREK
ncbi:arylsulfotransferase family protein [Halosimplex aquaticum]|uniref:Arylsulfotransferase family protein n=1 Tax=Halosimplex aquaticum TaxID=3026162 RepID=A0ABD5Y9E4_9EURY|nr:arylsulfotransferase family protein [Halosimplex aquaticum]